MSSIIGGVSNLTLGKLLDVWGRSEGYALSVIVLTLGIIMMAACQNVETYAAAQVFYWFGYDGLIYTLGIFVADTSSLRMRGLMYALTSSPYIVTMWMSGPTVEAIMDTIGFRWGFGIFAIVTPIITIPLWVLMTWNYRKAEKAGILPKHEASDRTAWQSASYYFVQFDGIGLILASAGLALFLLPFSLYSLQEDQWRSALVISMIIIGGLLLIAFVVVSQDALSCFYTLY
jgi:MFS family permease